MNRNQAIQAARNLRNRMTVHTLVAERKPFIAAVAAVEEVKDAEGNTVVAAVQAVEGQAQQPRQYESKTYKFIGEAKRAMRALGVGVALLPGETLPQ